MRSFAYGAPPCGQYSESLTSPPFWLISFLVGFFLSDWSPTAVAWVLFEWNALVNICHNNTHWSVQFWITALKTFVSPFCKWFCDAFNEVNFNEVSTFTSRSALAFCWNLYLFHFNFIVNSNFPPQVLIHNSRLS